MPNIFQASTGYRDPQKAMSIKALEARAKAAQEAMAQSTQPQVIADPLQGVAGLLNTFGSGLDQYRAENQAAAGRGQLAQLMAGIKDYQNIDPGTLAQIGTLDPEQQRFLQERMLEIQGREDEQKFRAGESELARKSTADLQTQQQTFTGGQNELARSSTERIADLNRQADEARQRMQDAAAADRQDDQQVAAQDLARLNAQLATEQEKDKLAAQTENIPAENAAREAEADRLGLPKGSPQRNEYVTTGEYTTHAPLKPADLFTPGQEVREKKLAEEATEWDTAGGAIAQKNIAQVGQALNLLKTRPGITGFMAGAADYALPDFVNKWYNPEGTIAQNAVRETVQASLRQVLGSQFTQLEGEALMNRAFDISLGPEENIRRAMLLMEQVQQIARNKQELSKQLKEKGNFLEYTGGSPIDAAKLQELLDTDYGTSTGRVETGTGEAGAGAGAGAGGGEPVKPADVDQETWDNMTDGEKALFR